MHRTLSLIFAVTLLLPSLAVASGGGPKGSSSKPSKARVSTKLSTSAKAARRAALRLLKKKSPLRGLLAASNASVSKLKVAGGLDAASTRKELRRVAKLARRRCKGLSGRFTFSGLVDKLGRFKLLRLNSASKAPRAEACLRQSLRGATFGKRERLARVDFSLYFSGISNVFGSSSGLKINNALGGLRGSSFGDARGVGGLGLRGTGRGGGGTGHGTIGLGKLGKGTGGGYGRLGGYRSKLKAPRVRGGHVELTGPMDKYMVRRIIRVYLARVRYCYERQLLRRPKLAGKLTVRFIIGSDGKVESALVPRSTFGAGGRAVETCVARVFRLMRFPRPKGSGVVVVSYPLVFEPAP